MNIVEERWRCKETKRQAASRKGIAGPLSIVYAAMRNDCLMVLAFRHGGEVE